MARPGRDLAGTVRRAARAPGGVAPESIGAELTLGRMDPQSIVELVRRMADIDSTYREAAERMGQLYLFADSIQAHELTRRLDEPMRNAARNELMLRALLDEIHAQAPAAPRSKRQRRPRDEG